LSAFSCVSLTLHPPNACLVLQVTARLPLKGVVLDYEQPNTAQNCSVIKPLEF